jgi:hypothetical protein
MRFIGWVQKAGALIVIFLFFCVAFAPVITATREISETKDMVEITVEVGNSDYTVLLTPNRAVELENLIDRTKKQLDEAKTLDETSRIYDETVVSFYELGLLPDSMSIKDAQRIVNGHKSLSRIGKELNGLNGGNLGILVDDENRFCLIAGHTNATRFITFIHSIFIRLLPHLGISPLGTVIFLFTLFKFFIPYRGYFPFALGNAIIFGSFSPGGPLGHPPDWSPSYGWVHTIGLNGMKRWDGKFYGNISSIIHFGGTEFYVGVHDFTGIKIFIPSPELFSGCFFLGAALLVKIR